MYRGFEREIIPMARSEGDHVYLISVLNNVLASGEFWTDVEEEQRRVTGEDGRKLFDPFWERTEVERKVSGLLEKVAKEVGTKSITAGKYYDKEADEHRLIFFFPSGHSLRHAKNTPYFPHHWLARG